MKKLYSIAIALLIVGCASLGGARHVATVTVVSAEATLGFIQDAELSIVCGRTGAPVAPACVDAATHKLIEGKLSTAFGLSSDLAKLVKAVRPDQPLPTQANDLIARITALIQDITSLIPNSPQKTVILQRLTAAK
jgi:hypothetical protein